MPHLLSSTDIAQRVDIIKSNQSEAQVSEAMDDLYCALSPMLLRYLSANTYIDEHTLEDVVQSAFVSAWLHIATLSDSEKFLSWLISIAKNELFGFLNKQKKIKRIEQELSVLSSDEYYQDPHGEVAYWISVLPELDRNIVLKKCVFEYSFDEIATHYNMKISRIKMRYYRALENIRAHHASEL